MRNLSPASVSELLQGKKTYIAAAIGLAYMVGVWLKLWDYDERVLAVLGMSGLAFLRAAVQKGPTFLLCFLLSAFCFSGIGCTQIIKSDKIFSQTSWIVGIQVKMSNPTSSNPLPDVKLGVMRETISLIPTATNRVFAPQFGAAYTGRQNAYNPISTDAQESVFSGDVMISTNATGGAVIPKLSR